jgi:hypothetical protein
MIQADVRLLEHEVKYAQAEILEHELRYLQDQLNSIATHATLLSTFVCYTFNNQDFTGKERTDLVQIVFCFFGAGAMLCAFLTIFCAVVVSLWGSTEALRAMNEAHLRKAVVTFREERDFCVRLFVYTLICTVCSVSTVGMIYWSNICATVIWVIMMFTLYFLFILYSRIKSRFILCPTIFPEGFLYDDFLLFTGMWHDLNLDLLFREPVSTLHLPLFSAFSGGWCGWCGSCCSMFWACCGMEIEQDPRINDHTRRRGQQRAYGGGEFSVARVQRAKAYFGGQEHAQSAAASSTR